MWALPALAEAMSSNADHDAREDRWRGSAGWCRECRVFIELRECRERRANMTRPEIKAASLIAEVLHLAPRDVTVVSLQSVLRSWQASTRDGSARRGLPGSHAATRLTDAPAANEMCRPRTRRRCSARVVSIRGSNSGATDSIECTESDSLDSRGVRRYTA